jgi:phosphoserine phosphatase RsbU/P
VVWKVVLEVVFQSRPARLKAHIATCGGGHSKFRRPPDYLIDFRCQVPELRKAGRISLMKLSLRTKLMAILVAAPAFLFLIAGVTAWMVDYRQRVAQHGGVFRGEAVQVARSLQLAVERCIGNLQDLLSLGDVAELLKPESNPGADLASDAWKTRTQQIDSVWSSLRLDSPQVQAVLNNSLAARLRAFGRKNWIFSEIVVADRAGRLVAATSRPATYDQSKESWWDQGMRLSRGEAVLEGFTYDESAGVLALNIGLPIVPEASGSAVGVLKAVVNVATLLASVTVLSTATEAQAEVVGQGGMVLLQLSDKSYVPSGAKISTLAASRLKPDAQGWFIAPLTGKDDSMIGFASVRLLGTFSLDQQIHGDPLYVVVHSPASTILSPLRQRAAMMGLAGMAIILLCSGLVAYFAQKTILSPLRTLSNAAEAMAATVLARKNARPGKKVLPPETALAEVGAIKTGDEMEEFAGDFSAMSGKLLRYQEDLKTELDAKTAEIQRDLDMARDFQRAFLPRDYPTVPTREDQGRLTLNFHHAFRAAMSVSGDFFDVIKLNDHCAGVLIADVMGHGTRSALVTAILRTLLHGLAQAGEDPGLFLSLLNSNFHATMKRTAQLIFVSACFVVFDTQKATARCASAGHPSPLMGNRRSRRVEPVYTNLKKNPALGLLPDASYQVFSRELQEDDIYILFTDGVEEAMSPNDEYYGVQRLARAITANIGLDIGDLTQSIVDDVLKFSGSNLLADDLCLVAVEAVCNRAEGLLRASDGQKRMQSVKP